MIDIRCHILDGPPCGPDSFAESLEMCRLAAAHGVRTIVATPRWDAGRDEPPLPFTECRRKLERLEAEMGSALSFRLGFALQFGAQLPALVARYGSNLALAGKRHLLISLPSLEIPEGTEPMWHELAQLGFSIVLAHPECNTMLRRNASRLALWVSQGVTLQIDAMSVVGAHGREVQRFAVECLSKYEGRAVVASNARWDPDHKNYLSAVREELTSSVGARRARTFVRETPAAIIGDVANGNVGRGEESRGLTSLLRAINPIKMLTGESYN